MGRKDDSLVKSVSRLFSFFMAIFCASGLFSILKRMRGRRWWTRYGSFLFLTTVIVFLVKRTPPSPATDAAADADADAAAADVDVDDWKSEDFVYQRHLLRPPPAHLRQATNDSAATVHVLLTLILITLDNAVYTKDTVTWIVVYSTSPVHFHVVSDKSSEWAIAKIFERAGRQANCNFNYTVHYVEDMLNPLHAVLAQQAPGMREELKDHVLAKMMPLVLPWHLRDVERVVFVNTTIKFRSDITDLFQRFERFQRTQVMGLTLTQSGRFEAPLATYRRLHAADATRSQLGLALPFGWPGWNTHLMLLDLERMRRSDTYRRYLDVQSGLELVRRYELRTEASLPTLDEWLTLAAIEEPGLFHTLPCQWNVQPVPSATPQLVQCRHHIRAMQFELAFN